MQPKSQTKHLGSVHIGQEYATVAVGRQSPRVGKILCQEKDANGVTRIWLDRLVFKPGTFTLSEQWRVEGCISTILVSLS